jgi:hypothetical protein
MNNTSQKISLCQPVTYQIKVPGLPDSSWSEWSDELTIAVENEGESPPITILTGDLDQAALHGLLRRLYAMCLPLISVIWIAAE